MSSRTLRFVTVSTFAAAVATGFAGCFCVSTGPTPTAGPITAGGTAASATGTPSADLKSGTHAADEGTPVDGGTIIVHLEAEPPHLNYLLQLDAWMNRMTNHHVLQMLVRENPHTYEFEGELAEKWEISDDKMTYTFHIRKGVKWHDGNPFSSADVQFTFDKILKDETAKIVMRETFKQYIASTEAPDADTFIIHASKPYAFLMTALADGVPILPKHIFEKGDFNKHPANRTPVGTGPFKFDHWDTGKEIVYLKNPDYWGPKAHLDKLVFKYVADRYTAFNLTKAGEIDVLERMLPEMVTKEITPEVLSTYNHVSYFPSSFNFVLFNLNRPYFSDVRVRNAFGSLWNTDGIIKDLHFGLAKPIFGPYWLESPSLHPTLQPYKYDPAKGAALLAEAGWVDSDKDGVLEKAGKKLSFNFLMTANSKTLPKILTFVKEDFTKAGIEMNITPIDWALFLGRLREGSFDLTSLIWILNSPRNDFSQLFHSRSIGTANNYGSFRSAKADELLDKIATTFDDAERVRLEHELQALLFEQLPYLFTMSVRIDSLVHKRFRGVRPSLKWFQLAEWWAPLAEQRK